MAKSKKFIFVTGGVLSSIGKGIAAASIGMLLEQRGIKVTMVKMDPYLNVDPGTMSPFQHGEVFVLDDGTETDLDLGHYQRFVQGAKFTRKNSFTAGRVYEAVIKKERAGGYLGKTVQVIPHVTDQIKENIKAAAEDADIAIVEVGGTVGDIEGLPFLEAIRQVKHEFGSENVLFVHLTLVPYIATAGELKTKPTQHSVKELREIGIQPDILLCRTDRALDKEIKSKIGLFCNVTGDCVFSARDAESIYDVPLLLAEEGLDDKIVEKLGIWTGRPDLSKWKAMVEVIHKPKHEVKIGIVGKYTDWRDTYKSISESLVHGGVANNSKVIPIYIDSEEIEKGNLSVLQEVHGILVPGGFGERGIEGKIKAIEYARNESIPFFGICLGMQLAVIEYARHVCGIVNANSAEFKPDGKENVIDLMESQKGVKDLGGTMRLGAYICQITPKHNGKSTHAYLAYGKDKVSERHRHRYEVSNAFRSRLEENGLVVCGQYTDKETGINLVEMVELTNHPWFLGCQFHPELLSRPLDPHPLFVQFIKASVQSAKGTQPSLKLSREGKMHNPKTVIPPMTLIAGPCVIEDEGLVMEIATELKIQLAGLPVQLFFKASFDKANRSSIEGFRGPGMEEGLKILGKVKDKLGLPVLTDIHETSQAEAVARVCDFLQIPAFLCRQTDLIVAVTEAALKWNRKINVKKGQFMAPWDTKNIVEKVRAVESKAKRPEPLDLFLTERGTSFGYNSLVVDMIGFQTMQSYGVPVIYDATHSIQMPGGGPGGKSTGGKREYLEVLARAAFAAGADGLFMECHPRPALAKSDGPNAFYLEHVGTFIKQILEFRKLAKSFPKLLPEANT